MWTEGAGEGAADSRTTALWTNLGAKGVDGAMGLMSSVICVLAKQGHPGTWSWQF